MDKYTDLYNKYKTVIDIQKKYNNRNNNDDFIICSKCGLKVHFNGVCSHTKIHPSIIDDKLEYMKNKYHFYDKSVYSNKKINYSNITRKNKYIIVCDSIEYKNIKKYIHQYEKNYKQCPICKKYFMNNNKTCSNECNKKMLSLKSKNFWNDDSNKEKIIIRNKKIGKLSQEYNKGRRPWNYGLNGNDYFKHFNKKDGSNSLIDSIKKSTFIPSTSIESKMEKFLNLNNFNYKHSWFCSSKQFDFLVDFDNIVLIIECDGDYWHKSKRRCLDINERNIKRLEDLQKEQIIYEKIKNTNKKWYVFRFWEYDINNNFDRIKNYLLDIKYDENNIIKINKEIKDWYMEQS